MTTAQFLIARIKAAGGFHTINPTKTGWLFAVRLDGDFYDTYIHTPDSGPNFIISLPIGNKLESSFFPGDERLLIMEYVVSCAKKVTRDVESA